MASDVLETINAEIASVEAEISAAQARLARLRSAREVLSEIGQSATPRHLPAQRPNAYRRISLRDHIEERLRIGGPCERGELFRRLVENGVMTTEAALATTLTRMKARGLVGNRGGVWDLVK